jgi:hypothetical protein
MSGHLHGGSLLQPEKPTGQIERFARRICHGLMACSGLVLEPWFTDFVY